MPQRNFGALLRYIFEDTFTPRTYDPQPLTKYEILQHLNQVVGMKPEPKKKPVDTSIPKPKKNPVSRGRIDHPNSNQVLMHKLLLQIKRKMRLKKNKMINMMICYRMNNMVE